MLYQDRPLNFAHRGASHAAPANTLAAFRTAVDLGADGIEFDVHLSKDGKIVVIHDFAVDTTTDGHGLVRDKTLAELQELDAGRWFAPAFAGQRIPTLQQVTDAVGRDLLLNIELKVAGLQDDGLAAAVVHHVERNHLGDRVVISSFSRLAVRRVKRIAPHLAVGWLYGPARDRFMLKSGSRTLQQCEALHPYYSMVDAEYKRWATARNYRVHVWTVDDPAEMQRLARLGVDMIITNRPDLLRGLLPAGEAAR